MANLSDIENAKDALQEERDDLSESIISLRGKVSYALFSNETQGKVAFVLVSSVTIYYYFNYVTPTTQTYMIAVSSWH